MRQGNGTDLLELDDPRIESIGIIYVSPNDDRKNVLAAIITQENLQRKQVAIVLSDANKAFSRPQDFDDLKAMRRKLQTQIVFIAPAGPGPSVFARQRGFLVYSSLESYANALSDEEVENKNATGRKGWLFNRSKQKSTAHASSTSAAATPSTSFSTQPLVAQNQEQDAYAVATAVGVGATASSFVADELPSAHSTTGTIDTSPALVALQHDRDVAASTSVPAPMHVNGTNGVEPGIIDLSPKRGRATVKLPAVKGTGDPAVSPSTNSSTSAKVSRRSSGKMAVVSGASMNRSAAGGGSRPPMRGRVGSGGGGNRNTARNWLIGIGLLLLTLLLICGGLAYAQPKALGAFNNVIPGLKPQTQPDAATVTITPDSQIEANSYVITGVTTGTPNTSQRQIGARVIVSTSPSQQKTVNATGVKQTPAVQATGTLTFYNSQSFAQTVASGTVFIVAGGVKIVNDVPANVPAAHLPTTGFVTVHAHALTGGSSGNIGAFVINTTCCVAGISVQNTVGFSGGQDPQNYTFVQQSDIDGAANPLKSPTLQQAQAGLKLNANEQPAGGSQCTPSITSNQIAGAKASNVTVTVSATCKTEAYDQKGLQSLVSSLLQTKADTDWGQGYVLAGAPNGIVVQTTVQSVTDKTVSLLVNAKGKYYYLIDDTQKKEYARLIAGLSTSQAIAKLKSQRGVADVTVASGVTTLPTNPNQITITVQSVQGLQGGGTSTGSGTPPPVTSPGSSGAGTPTPVPGNGNIPLGS